MTRGASLRAAVLLAAAGWAASPAVRPAAASSPGQASAPPAAAQSATGQGSQPAARRPRGAGIGIGALAWLDGVIERAELPEKASWQQLRPKDALRTGDSFRTGEDATARLEFPWMAVTLGGSTMLTIPSSTVLSTVLEHGRAEFAGPGREIVKIRVGDAEVRGGGRLVLRRSAGRTTASALDGSFRVRAAGRTVEIKGGEATIVADGQPPERPSGLPKTPFGIQPGRETLYVRAGQGAELRWQGSAPRHRVEVLALGKDQVLLARDVDGPPLRLQLPWLGTYRWRVAARDARGIEGRPSDEGLICSVDR